MKFNLEKALADEEYARNIVIKGDITYDDYIFILSAMFGSGIDLKIWIDVFQKDEDLFNTLLRDASVIHCYSWEDAITDIMDDCKLVGNKSEFKTNKESREFVKANISPILLKSLYDNQSISLDTVYEALDQAS